MLAILIQLGLTKPLDNLYDYLTNKGELGDHLGFNQSKLHSTAYIKNHILKGLKGDKEAAVDAERKKDVKRVALELKEKGCRATCFFCKKV